MTKQFALLSVLLAAAVLPACAQVAPSATGSRPTLSAGALFTYTQPNYDQDTNTVNSTKNHLFGIGGFVDYRMSRWVQLEAEGRWQHWNQTQGLTVSENLYAVGIRDPIRTFGRFTPYGKAMVGIGSGNFLDGPTAVYTLGGGVDYHLKKRLALRADFEYQHWRVFQSQQTRLVATPVKPYTAALGFTYKIF